METYTVTLEDFPRETEYTIQATSEEEAIEQAKQQHPRSVFDSRAQVE